MGKDPKVWKIEGTDFRKIDFLSQSFDELKEKWEKAAKKVADEANRELRQANKALWRSIYETLGIDEDGRYSLDCSARAVGILIVREKPQSAPDELLKALRMALGGESDVDDLCATEDDGEPVRVVRRDTH